MALFIGRTVYEGLTGWERASMGMGLSGVFQVDTYAGFLCIVVLVILFFW